MKKFVYLTFLALSVCACGGGDDNEPGGNNGGGNSGGGSSTELVFTGVASDITSSSATITCNYTSAANISTLQLGVIYSDNQQAVENKQATKSQSTSISGNTYQLTISNLSPKTVYYYRAYMISGGVTYYGATNNFTTLDNTYEYSGHKAADLGLPSGTKWATTNLGAESPEEYGKYYAWGEKYSKTYFTKQNYDYQENWNLGMDISGSIYDAAIRNWGEPWCMPTKENMEELVQYCTFKWTTINEVNGALITGPNGNSIFLPAGGYGVYANINNVGESGEYWSSNINGAPGSTQVYSLDFSSSGINVSSQSIRYQGRPIRPVCK